MQRFTTVIITILLAVPAVLTAAAANLVVNPDFDTDLSGWDTFASWSTEDWEVSPGSGSATITNSIPSTSAIILVEQCIELPSLADSYTLSGWMLNPAGQSGSGHGKLTLVFYSAAECADASMIEGFDTPEVQQTGLWERVEVAAPAPAGTLSTKVYSFVQKLGAAGAVQIFVDHIALEPTPAIFSDGFESGDTTSWSEAIE